MKNLNTKKIIISILLLFFIFFLDRITKIIILNTADEAGKVDIYINYFLNLYLVWNKGIGFGLLTFNEAYYYNVITLLIVLIIFLDQRKWLK